MRIMSLALSKYKTVACEYEAETGRHQFATVLTTQKALHDLIVDREPDRVVIEICSIAGWVCDLVRSLGIGMQVASTNDERWQWRGLISYRHHLGQRRTKNTKHIFELVPPQRHPPPRHPHPRTQDDFADHAPARKP